MICFTVDFGDKWCDYYPYYSVNERAYWWRTPVEMIELDGVINGYRPDGVNIDPTFDLITDGAILHGIGADVVIQDAYEGRGDEVVGDAE